MGVNAVQGGKYHNKIGILTLQHPEKCGGKTHFQFKSNLERAMMAYLDKSDGVISWNYEPKSIPYIDITQADPKSGKLGKQRKYYIDFVATIKESSGFLRTVWIEVKSSRETTAPSKTSSDEDKKTWIRNNCKWNAAKQLCESKGIKFLVISDKELGNG